MWLNKGDAYIKTQNEKETDDDCNVMMKKTKWNKNAILNYFELFIL
jgi:hypothetical protein